MSLGSLVNSVLSPVGIKLFPGGPYADNSAGDKMQGNLNQYLAQLAPIIASISSGAGVTNPLTGTPGAFTNDPYGLSPLEQGQVNQQAGVDAQGTNAAMQAITARESARGLGQSSLLPAAQAYLSQQLLGQVGGERLRAGQNAYTNRMNANQLLAQLLGTAYGAQQGVTQYQGNVAEQSHQEAMQNLGGILGFGLGKLTGMGGGGGTAPFNPNDSSGTGVGNVGASGLTADQAYLLGAPWGNAGFMGGV